MKKIILTVLGAALVMAVEAQEYKVAKSSGRLEIREVNHVSIEGYNGNEIVFTSRSGGRDDDERAKGLRALSSYGLEDNTGLGLSVVDKGEVIEVNQLKKTEGPDIKIMVPKGVTVSYTHSSPYGDEVEFKNFAGEIRVSTVHNGVVLTNTTGVMNIKTVHGDIDASFANPLTSAVNLESVHGHVDVALPAAIKANLTLSTDWGEVLVDPDFKIELEKTGDLTKYSGRIRGKLNGGGTDITLTSNHDNVYLRKSK
jgi:Putative adhesin